MASPRVKLPELSAALWKAFGAGMVSEDDAQALAELIEARKALGKIPGLLGAVRKASVGSRPRSSESLERRRRWTASGWLPPQLAARFTMGEAAVLSVVASEVSRNGRCTLPIGAIAGMAGVGKTTVRTALQQAKGLGILTVEEHRLTAFRNAPNTVCIISAEWTTWLRLAVRRVGKGSGSRSAKPTSNLSITKGKETARFMGNRWEPSTAVLATPHEGSRWPSETRWQASASRRHI